MVQAIDPVIFKKIDQLYKDSKKGGGFVTALPKILFKSEIRPEDFKNHYLAISKDQGEFIYNLIVKKKLKKIVEFGTSFGISTLFLAAAAKECGGKIITSELIAEKAKKASQNFSEAGVQNLIDLRVGDAMKTLSKDVGKIDFLLLDGWKDLYLPLLKQLEPQFHEQTVVYVDNANMKGVEPTLKHLEESHYYETEVLHQGRAVLATRVPYEK